MVNGQASEASVSGFMPDFAYQMGVTIFARTTEQIERDYNKELVRIGGEGGGNFYS